MERLGRNRTIVRSDGSPEGRRCQLHRPGLRATKSRFKRQLADLGVKLRRLALMSSLPSPKAPAPRAKRLTSLSRTCFLQPSIWLVGMPCRLASSSRASQPTDRPAACDAIRDARDLVKPMADITARYVARRRDIPATEWSLPIRKHYCASIVDLSATGFANLSIWKSSLHPCAFHSTGRLQHPSGRRPGASALVA